MDTNRFDRFTKNLGARLSRRAALRGGAGIAATGLAAASVTAAREGTPGAVPATDGKTFYLFV